MVRGSRKDSTVKTAIDDQDNVSRTGAPKLSAWLWSPWYAKLWWAAIPIWWMGMAASTRVDALETFYRGALAGYLNILFFPMRSEEHTSELQSLMRISYAVFCLKKTK